MGTASKAMLLAMSVAALLALGGWIGGEVSSPRPQPEQDVGQLLMELRELRGVVEELRDSPLGSALPSTGPAREAVPAGGENLDPSVTEKLSKIEELLRDLRAQPRRVREEQLSAAKARNPTLDPRALASAVTLLKQNGDAGRSELLLTDTVDLVQRFGMPSAINPRSDGTTEWVYMSEAFQLSLLVFNDRVTRVQAWDAD